MLHDTKQACILVFVVFSVISWFIPTADFRVRRHSNVPDDCFLKLKPKGFTPSQPVASAHLFHRESRVVGFTPKSSAAPCRAFYFPPAFSRIAKRFSRSRCSF